MANKSILSMKRMETPEENYVPTEVLGCRKFNPKFTRSRYMSSGMFTKAPSIH
jgi:hypothetical protein